MNIDFHLDIPSVLVIPFLLGYPIPAVIALCRKGRYRAPAIVVDLTLAWTLIGWVVALWLALSRAVDVDDEYEGDGDDVPAAAQADVPWRMTDYRTR